jgi:hypothetical protein
MPLRSKVMLHRVVLVGVVIPCANNQNDSLVHFMEAALNQLEYIYPSPVPHPPHSHLYHRVAPRSFKHIDLIN